MSLTKEGRNDQSGIGNVLPEAVRLADRLAVALHRQYGESHGAIKTVERITGCSERTVKNWFQAKNGPSGESLIRLCRHSDQVFETVLLLAGRERQLKVKKLGEMRGVLRQMLTLLAEIDGLRR